LREAKNLPGLGASFLNGACPNMLGESFALLKDAEGFLHDQQG